MHTPPNNPGPNAPGATATPGPVLVRGGGDLGTGVALALRAAGRPVVVADLPLPGAMRLHVAFAYAAVLGRWEVGGVQGVHVRDLDGLRDALREGWVPVWTGGHGTLLRELQPAALVDARLRGLSREDLSRRDAPVVIALGPGWVAGRDCHAVIETCRGPSLGRALTRGRALAHTGVPGEVQGLTAPRILRSPAAGTMGRVREIGDFVRAGDVVARVRGAPIRAAIDGMIRGLKLDGVAVGRGHKVGDVDPRRDRRLLAEPTDKARRIGQGVLDALRGLEHAGGRHSPREPAAARGENDMRARAGGSRPAREEARPCT